MLMLSIMQLGHDQAQALEPTFNALNGLGLFLSQAIHFKNQFEQTDSVKRELRQINVGLMRLVAEIATFYRNEINGMTKSSVTIDFDARFGASINQIWAKKERLSRHIWDFQLRHKHYAYSYETIRQKLSASDEQLKVLTTVRLADKSERSEGTCEWIQDHLLDFLRSGDKLFTLTGKSGSGKSMLMDWMKERLSRPLGRKSYETLSYAFGKFSQSPMLSHC